MVGRTIERLLSERLQAYPAVALVGPRQCGKTTLARAMEGAYFMARLNTTANMINASRRFLVSQTRRPSDDGRRVSCNLSSFLDYLATP